MDRQLLSDLVAAYAFQPATAYWRSIELAALVELGLTPGTGIDIGCGDGKLTAILATRISLGEVVGLDPDSEETAAARRRNFYTAVHTAGGDEIPEPDGRFDFAISNSVLEHIPDLDPVLGEIARVLRRDGRFYLTVPHAGFHALLAGPIGPGRSRAAYLARLDRRLAHIHYLSETEWRTLLDRHGFTVEAVRFYLDRNQVQRWETLSRWTAGVLDAISRGRAHPIRIQRSLGLRQAQNAFSWPAPCARALASLLALGIPPATATPAAASTGCLAIRCRRR